MQSRNNEAGSKKCVPRVLLNGILIRDDYYYENADLNGNCVHITSTFAVIKSIIQ